MEWQSRIKYLLWTREHKGKIEEYYYLTLDEEGGWYTSRTSVPEFSMQAPPGMNDAVEMWFKIMYRYADLNLRDFLIQMGIKL